MIVRTFRRVVPAVGFALLLTSNFAACSDGDSSGSSVNSLIDAQCAALDSCCKADGQASDPQACKAFYSAFGAGATVGPNAGECEALLRERTADGSVCTLGTRKDGVDVCNGALGSASGSAAGTKAPGTPCEDDDECLAPAGGEGRCDYRTTYDANNQSTTTQTCVQTRKGQAGEGPCSATVYAQGGSGTSYGSNTERLDSTVECYETDGLYCPQYGETCRAYVGVGEACGGPDSAACNPTTSYCRYTDTDGNSLCVARLAVGESCTPSDQCQTGARCTNGACLALKQTGEACELGSECASSTCVNKKCSGSSGGLSLCFH
jgi:hypothetical protein